jgi:hypothetical protein
VVGSTEAKLRGLLGAQSAYYGITGLWPLIHYDSFERLTGPKSERWLVETVSGLITVIAASLAIGSRRPVVDSQSLALAAGSAAALGGIDVLYLARGRLRLVYGADAAAQGAFVALIAQSIYERRRQV